MWWCHNLLRFSIASVHIYLHFSKVYIRYVIPLIVQHQGSPVWASVFYQILCSEVCETFQWQWQGKKIFLFFWFSAMHHNLVSKPFSKSHRTFITCRNPASSWLQSSSPSQQGSGALWTSTSLGPMCSPCCLRSRTLRQYPALNPPNQVGPLWTGDPAWVFIIYI